MAEEIENDPILAKLNAGKAQEEDPILAALNSPKTAEPSMQGGKSGSVKPQTPPSTSTSVLEDLESGSWTQKISPQAQKPATEEQPQMPLFMKPAEVDKIKKTPIVQIKQQSASRAAQFKNGLDMFERDARVLRDEYERNPTPQLEAKMEELAKNYKDTKEAYQKELLKEKSVGGKIGKTKVEDESVFSEVYNSLKAGSESLGASLAKTPSFIYDIFALPQNLIAKYTGLNVGTSSDEFAAQYNIPKNKVATYYENAAKQTKAEIEKKYDKSITDYIANGDYKKAIGATLNAIAESTPVTISLMVGGGAGISPLASTIGGAAVFGAEKKSQLDKEAPFLDNATKTSNALSTGLFEGIFENWGLTKLGGMVADIFKKQGEEAAVDFAKKSFREVYAPIVKKYLGVAAEEPISEMETQFAQNVVDKYSGYKPDLDLKEGIAEAGLVGFASSGVYSSPVAMLDLYTTKKARKKALELNVKKQMLETDIANPNTPDSVKEVLSNEISATNQKMADLREEDSLESKGVEAEDKSKVTENWNKIDALNESISKGNLSEDAKKLIEQKIIDLESENESILSKYSKKETTPQVDLQKYTGATNEKYGYIDRGDGKGKVELTKEEFEAEQAKMQPKAKEEVIGDEEFAEFEKNKSVTPERISAIAEKINNGEKLSTRENKIVAYKKAEIKSELEKKGLESQEAETAVEGAETQPTTTEQAEEVKLAELPTKTIQAEVVEEKPKPTEQPKTKEEKVSEPLKDVESAAKALEEKEVLAEFGDNINEGVTTVAKAIKNQLSMESGGLDKPSGVNIWTDENGDIKYIGNNAERSKGLNQNIIAFDIKGKILKDKSIASPELVQAVEQLLSKPKEVTKEKAKPTIEQKIAETAKALDGVDATKLGYVKYEDAIIIEPQVDFENLPKGVDEMSREARSQAIREQENKPPKYKKYAIGTRAVDRFGEVYELREVPLDEAISKQEGTQREATIDKYVEWVKQGNEMPPAKGVENFATEGGKIKITDGNHRYQAAKKAGLKKIPVWVALTDKKNTARPIYAKNEISEAYHADKAAGKETELTKAVEKLLKPTEEKVSGGLTQEEKTNLETIAKEAGVNFQEIRNVYNKYGEGKSLSEITLEDYKKAQEKRDKGKEVKQELPLDQKGRKVGSPEYKAGKNHKTGRTITKRAPDGTKIKGTFKLVSAKDLLPSHNPVTFSKNENFPQTKDGKTINDRDYETDKPAQAQVVDIAQNLDGTAVTQMPTVSKEGIVYDGNNRTMSRQLAAKNKTDQEYLDALKEQAEMYGFTEEQVNEVENPMLVFEVEENLPFDTETMAKFNKAEKKAQSPVQRAVAISKRISDRAKRQLALLYEQVEVPSDVTSNPKMMKEAMDILVSEGLVQTLEIPRFVDKGVATPDGVSLLEGIVMAASLNEDAIVALSVQGMGDVKTMIIKNIVGLMQNSTKGADSLIPDIAGAINIVQKAKAGKILVKDYLSQYDVFSENSYTLGEMCMALLLDTKKPTELKKFLANYNQDVGVENLFGEDTSKQAILDRTLLNIISDYEKIKKNLEGIAAERKEPIEGGAEKPQPTTKSSEEVETPKQEKDAIQKQTTSEVPVQPEARVGEGVEEGKPETKSEKAAKEGQKEINELFDAYESIEDSKGMEKRKAAEQFRNMQQSIKNPILKRIFDNISDIHSQLEKQGLITKTKGCP